MNAVVTMQTRVEDYLAERRRLGYRLRSISSAAARPGSAQREAGSPR